MSKRQPNFTADEIEVLVRGVEKNGKVLTSVYPKYNLAVYIMHGATAAVNTAAFTVEK